MLFFFFTTKASPFSGSLLFLIPFLNGLMANLQLGIAIVQATSALMHVVAVYLNNNQLANIFASYVEVDASVELCHRGYQQCDCCYAIPLLHWLNITR
uniref:Uncharacterized protein n=1 Tax=Cucumis melo TaxID=3656 RepID=A0A9I9EGW7_CUCME